jgi:adenylylsulfate kinase
MLKAAGEHMFDRRDNANNDRRSSNVVWNKTEITKEQRNQLNKQRSAILWFTGLSGSGKSTVANAVEEHLHNLNIRTYILDGDNIRHGLNSDLGFSDNDRKENIRRIGETSKLFIDAGVMVLTAFISPFENDRKSVRQIVHKHEFIEIHVRCPLNICEKRDVKGLYKKARNGEISEFTGIDSPYEKPRNPEITIDTSVLSIEDATRKIIEYLIIHSHIKTNTRDNILHKLQSTLLPGSKIV